MSATPTVVQPTADSISVDKLNAELDEFNQWLLARLEQGKAIVEESAASITQEKFDAGLLLTYRSMVQPTTGVDGQMIPAQPERWEKLTAAEFTKLQARLTLLGKLVNLLDKPIGNATLSYAQLLRGDGKRWSALR